MWVNLDFIKFIFEIKVWDVGLVLSRNKKAPASPNISISIASVWLMILLAI